MFKRALKHNVKERYKNTMLKKVNMSWEGAVRVISRQLVWLLMSLLFQHDYVKEEERLLTLDGFLSYVIDEVKQDVRMLWRALLACGFDLHFERCVILCF